MRHKWKKTNKQYYIKAEDVVRHVVRQTRKCIHCGLLKGNVSTIRYFPILVYFDKNEEMLSKEILPFKCTEKLDGIFLSEKDFLI